MITIASLMVPYWSDPLIASSDPAETIKAIAIPFSTHTAPTQYHDQEQEETN